MPTAEPASSDHREQRPSGVIALTPHPANRSGPLRSLLATATLDPGGCIRIEFTLHGALSRLRLASPSPAPRRRDQLWRHTCFELFARRGAERGYLEFNFAPSGDWAAWTFSDYRRDQRPLDPARVTIATLPIDNESWSLRAQTELGNTDPPCTWWLNLAAVIEADDGQLSYWAVQHSGARPDFHARADLALALRANRVAAPPQSDAR